MKNQRIYKTHEFDVMTAVLLCLVLGHIMTKAWKYLIHISALSHFLPPSEMTNVAIQDGHSPWCSVGKNNIKLEETSQGKANGFIIQQMMFLAYCYYGQL